MPVQINEVIVKAVVDPCSGSGDITQPEQTPTGNSTGDNEILQQILEIIKEKKER